MADAAAHAVRYGHKIRLAARSAYGGSGELHAIGYYEKNGRHGILSCVPPLGDALDHLFTEDEFLVLDPVGQRDVGEIVEYGRPVVLVNQHGMVWNNKTGGITGYIGPRARNIAGEMYVAFRQGGAVATSSSIPSASGKDKDKLQSSPALKTNALGGADASLRSRANSSSSSSLSSMDAAVSSAGGGVGGGPVLFGDANVTIAVVESNRHSNMFNKRLSNFKKPTSRIAGGYICSDGKGAELRFTVWPAKPKIEQISMMNKLITSYSYGQKIALPVGLLESTASLAADGATAKRGAPSSAQGLKRAEIFFTLSNQATAVLPGKWLQEKLSAHAASGTGPDDLAERESVFVLPLRNGPGELVVRLTGVAPSKTVGKLTGDAAMSRAGGKSKSSSALTASPPTLSLVLRAARTLRMVPVPVFALVYAIVMQYSWGALSTLSNGLQRELVVLVLVMLPLFYVAVKVDHPFSSLFDPPAPIDAASPSEDEPQESGSLKLIVTEYRFTSPGQSASAAAPAPATSSVVPPVKSAAVNGNTEATPAPAAVAQVVAATNPSTTMLVATGKVPQRFINAEKGDEEKALERYNVTTEWRREEGVDGILSEPSPHFRTIKANYPHYYHKRGKNGEPVYYEKPGKINLKALKGAGLTLDDLMRNYLMITEFLWQVIEQDDNRKCISVLDVDGIGFTDFAGEAVDYVRKASAVSGQHYPERCAYIFVINVPSWFNVIWNTVKGMVDEVTREKVIIVRGKKKILEALAEKIPMESIPAEYGGESDGKSPEEDLLFNLMGFLNQEDGAPPTNPIASILAKKPIKH